MFDGLKFSFWTEWTSQQSEQKLPSGSGVIIKRPLGVVQSSENDSSCDQALRKKGVLVRGGQSGDSGLPEITVDVLVARFD